MFLFKPYYIMYYVIGIYIAVLTVYSLYLFVFPTGAHYTTRCVDFDGELFNKLECTQNRYLIILYSKYIISNSKVDYCKNARSATIS